MEAVEGEVRFPLKSAGFTLRLPTRNGVPSPSPDLASPVTINDEDKAEPPALDPWSVRGLLLPAEEAVELLVLLPLDGTEAETGLHMGSDARFWAAASRFATDLLARGRFIPTVRLLDGGGASAGWEPLFRESADQQKLELLARAMPPVCRSLPLQTEGNLRDVTPPELLAGFLRAAVDGLVRHSLAEAPRDRQLNRARKSAAVFRWLEALGSPYGHIDGTGFELRSLHQSVQEWVSPLRSAMDGQGFRTCFRLEPPETEEGERQNGIVEPVPGEKNWELHFLLQAADDPSLLIPAEQVWRERGDTLRYLNRRFEHPQERLLADLGRAARVFPRIEESLSSARPESCRISTIGAYEFLTEAAPLLEQSGYGVLVPNWWEKRSARPQLGAKLNVMGGGPGEGLMGKDAIVQYNWQLALGDKLIDRAEFERLAELKTPLVKVRGQWIELNPEQVRDALRFWESRPQQGKMSVGEALRSALSPEREDGLPVIGVEANGWMAELLERIGDDESVGELSQPDGFNGELRPYQLRGFSWLSFLKRWGLGACLADDMGLGKTIQMIALLLHDRERGESCGPTLLVCPTSVLGNWQREVSRFGPELKVLVHHGSDRASGESFAEIARGHDLVISSYSLVHRDEELLASVPWDGVVLDEAQNVKNSTTKQAQSVRRLPARYKVALTGTPVENRLSELWSIMEFLNPGYLGSAEKFRQQYAIPIERWQDKERSSQLKKLVQPFILRRLKTDRKIIQDLPEKMEMKVFCNLTREQATLYEAVVQDMMRQVEESDGIKRKGLVLATLTRLKQVCNHPALYLGDNSALPGRSGKLARLEEMLEEALSEGDRAILFTQYAEFGGRMRAYLEQSLGREVQFLHGGTPPKARDQMVARFQDDPGGPPIFILSLKAGGVGLNLTRANRVFHFDRWWNPAVEDQATDRAFRIGQRKDVQVHKFICAGTLEERIDALIESKKGLSEAVIGAGEGWLTELTTDELRGLIALRQDAVAEE